jgi:hypothetical protein
MAKIMYRIARLAIEAPPSAMGEMFAQGRGRSLGHADGVRPRQPLRLAQRQRVQEQWKRNPRRLAHADRLARAVNLDMAAA